MRKAFVPTAVLLAATAAVFGPAVTHPFIALDDWLYITQNPHVRAGLTPESVRWAVGGLEASNWHPLTWLSHMLDVELFGLAPAGHHLTSVVLHGATVAALFQFLKTSTGALWPSFWVSLAFAVHPLRVESVAWAAERKDVLSGLLWMLTLGAYTRYARRPGPGRWLAALVAFALGLAAKPVVLSLPGVLLLLDFWPLGRLRSWRGIGRPLVEKLPFLLLSALSAAVTIAAQAGATNSAADIPLSSRLGNALVSLVVYIGQTAWPGGLSIIYPLDLGGPAPAAAAAAALAVLALSALVVGARRRWPFVVAGAGWYLLALAPVLGLIQVGVQARADRYTYLPSVGLFVAVVWSLRSAARSAPRLRAWLAVAGACIVMIWGAAAVRYLLLWKDGVALFRHALQTPGGNWMARYALGLELAQAGRFGEAAAELERFAAHLPEHPEGHYNLGLAYEQLGEPGRAITAYRQALRLQPDYAGARKAFGLLLLNGGSGQPGRLDEAAEQFAVLVALRPNDADAHYWLGRALHEKGQIAGAQREYRAAVRLEPGHARAHNDLGIALAQVGDRAAAIEEFRAALRIQPELAEAGRNLEQALAISGSR